MDPVSLAVLAGASGLSAMGQAYFGGKASDRERKMSEAFAERERAAQERESARRMAAELELAKHQEDTTRTGQQRMRSMFMAGMMGAFGGRSAYPEFPTSQAIDARARKMNPQAFNYRDRNVPDLKWYEKLFGMAAVGAGAGANTYALSQLYGGKSAANNAASNTGAAFNPSSGMTPGWTPPRGGLPPNRA